MNDLLHRFLRKVYTLLFLHQWKEIIMPIDPGRINKILIIRNDNIGDVVCTTPFIENLRKAFPKAFLSILVCRLTEDVVRGNPDLDHVYVYDKSKHGRYQSVWVAWWKQYQVLQEIRREQFDLVLGVRLVFTVSQAWMAFYSRAKWRIGRIPGPKEKKFAFFYTHFIPVPDHPKHEIERTLDFLEPLDVKKGPARLFFPLTSEAEDHVSHFLEEKGLQEKHPLIGIHLTSRPEVGKTWADDRYADLLRTLKNRGDFDVVFSYGPDQTETAQRILQALNFPQPHFLSSDLKKFAAYARALDLLVTVDGGPMHIGAALGTPMVALFGKADLLEWAPWGEGHLVLRKGNACDNISVEDVLAALELQLERSKKNIRIQNPGVRSQNEAKTQNRI